MDHIEQLKKIRADALARLRMSEDFRLAGKLGQLLAELGSPVEDNVAMGGNAPIARSPFATGQSAQSAKPAAEDDSALSDEIAEKLDAALGDGGKDDKSPLPFQAPKGDTAKAS